MKKRMTAAFMAFAFGWLGLHKFYLNQVPMGVFFLVLTLIGVKLFTLPISALLGFIDAVKLISMSDEAFDRKYNSEYFQKRPRNARQKRNQMPQHRQDPYEKPTASKRAKVNPFKKSGIKKYKEFDIDDAIEDFKRGLEIDTKDVSLHFNIACAYSLNEQKDLTYHHIQKAVENGLRETNRILEHDDLAFIRIQPEFEAFKANGFKNMPGDAKFQKPLKDDKLLSQLGKLEELRQKGLLAETEFLVEKEKLFRG